MSKTISLLSALLCTFIWGTTFIAQDTGMDEIGPFTFNAVRFFVGFLAIAPLVILFEIKKFKSEFRLDFKTFVILSLLIGLSLFLGSALQQVALLKAIPNAGPYLELSIEGEDYYPWQQNLFLDNPFKVENGCVNISDKPGWGVVINPDWLDSSEYQVSEVN